MTVSRKTLTLAETFFQEEVKLEIDVKSSTSVTLLDTFNANKISINQSCGGSGTCGTCRVEIIQGLENLSNQTADEVEFNLALNQRLSCQTKFNCDLTVKIIFEPI